MSAGNIAELMAQRARQSPGRPALIAGGRRHGFGELQQDIERLAAGLAGLGAGPGTRVAVFIPPGLDFFSTAFALFRLGAVPVLIDPGIGFSRLGRCLADAAPEIFIGTPKAQAARLLGGWARASLKRVVTAGRWPGTSLEALRRAAPPTVPSHEPQPGVPAAILFTSGSTGAPKGAVYTHPMFLAQVERLRELFAIEPGEVSVPTFPLFALFDVALGMTAVLPEMDFTRPGSVDPSRILGPVLEHGASQLFGSPALLDAVGRHLERERLSLPSLKRVLSAGAPVAPRILERFQKALAPGVEIHTPYGATEALPVCTIGSAEILGETAAATRAGKGVCVGRPVRGVELFVIAVSDEPILSWSEELALPEGRVGEIVVRGPVVSPRYHNRPLETAQAKIAGPDGRVLHRMGDLGYRDPSGRLWFCGRKSQRVETAAGTLYTIPVEGVFNQHPRVRRTALVGAGPAGARLPVLCVELEPCSRPSEALKAELLALGAAHEHTRAVRTVLFHPRFPVDIRHNAKIFRERLAEWADARVRR